MKDQFTTFFYRRIVLFIITILLPAVVWLVTLVVNFNYFENHKIDPYILNRINMNFSAFIISIISLPIIYFVIYRYLKSANLLINIFSLFSFLYPLLFLSVNICAGLIIIFNTENLFNPELSTFKWETSLDFSKFTLYSGILGVAINLLIFIILLISIGVMTYFRVYKSRAKKESI